MLHYTLHKRHNFHPLQLACSAHQLHCCATKQYANAMTASQTYRSSSSYKQNLTTVQLSNTVQHAALQEEVQGVASLCVQHTLPHRLLLKWLSISNVNYKLIVLGTKSTILELIYLLASNGSSGERIINLYF